MICVCAFSFAAKNNVGVIIALWAPIILVCYHFDNSENKKKGLKASLSRRFGQMPNIAKQEQPDTDKQMRARFAQIWNIIITSFRKEDLISNR
ncbi:hypothetical protein BHE74_00017549 [Ensete ventricosum]|nr:hypothetical protein BHE74_00017549 [Ensete ventricosum]